MSDVIGTAFYFVLNMSIVAAIVGMILILLRRIKKIPRNVIYFLWSLVFIRLVFPFAVSSKASALNVLGRLIRKMVRVPVFGQDKLRISMSNYIGIAEEYFPITYGNDNLKAVFEVSSFIWIAGVGVAILVAFILYIISRVELAGAWRLRDNIYVSSKVDSPIVFGIFKQRVVIPSFIKEESPELKFILLHEQVHMKRHDNFIRLLAIFTACLHWFNPFVWMFLNLFLNDMELSCDLKAIGTLRAEEKKKYAQALVNMSSGQKVFLSAAFGRNIVKTRVLNVLSYNRISLFAAVFLTFFIVAVVISLVTNPVV